MSDLGGSAVQGAEVVFRLSDPQHAAAGVRLWKEPGLPVDGLDFVKVNGGWELRRPRPDVNRMEYLFRVRDDDGVVTTTTDPANPLVAHGAFGDHSVLEMPEYAAPQWLDVEPVPSTVRLMRVESTPVGHVEVSLWAPADAATHDPLPLLVSHDGPEFDAYAGLTQYVGAMVAGGRLPRLRLAMVKPARRNLWYSANTGYADALTQHVLPAIHHACTTKRGTVMMGASLGAVAALHAEWLNPGTFAGLFLQSGSFFTVETDSQEKNFDFFDEVVSFVAEVRAATEPPSIPAVAMTSGSMEENVHNNRVMAGHLERIGCVVEFTEHPDLHNFTAWRDVLDPCLTGLLQRVWGA